MCIFLRKESIIPEQLRMILIICYILYILETANQSHMRTDISPSHLLKSTLSQLSTYKQLPQKLVA